MAGKKYKNQADLVTGLYNEHDNLSATVKSQIKRQNEFKNKHGATSPALDSLIGKNMDNILKVNADLAKVKSFPNDSKVNDSNVYRDQTPTTGEQWDAWIRDKKRNRTMEKK